MDRVNENFPNFEEFCLLEEGISDSVSVELGKKAIKWAVNFIKTKQTLDNPILNKIVKMTKLTTRAFKKVYVGIILRDIQDLDLKNNRYFLPTVFLLELLMILLGTAGWNALKINHPDLFKPEIEQAEKQALELVEKNTQ